MVFRTLIDWRLPVQKPAGEHQDKAGSNQRANENFAEDFSGDREIKKETAYQNRQERYLDECGEAGCFSSGAQSLQLLLRKGSLGPV